MSWTDGEWQAFCGLLEEGWPGEFTDDTARAWRVLLDDVPPGAAAVGLKRLLLKGGRFRPSVSELLAESRSDPYRPTFDEAYPAVYRCAAKGEVPDGTDPLVAGFVQRQGVQRLGLLPLDDPEWGEKHRRDLRAAWDEHVSTFDARQVAELASGSPRRLDAAKLLGLGA